MFQRKRLLKKEKVKVKTKKIIIFFLLFLIGFLVTEFLILNFSFGRNTYLNPIAKNQTSFVLLVENLLDKNKIEYESVSQNEDSSLDVKLKNGGEVILSSKKNIQTQISSLQLILSRLTIEEGKKLKNLDFRYDNPVVSF